MYRQMQPSHSIANKTMKKNSLIVALLSSVLICQCAFATVIRVSQLVGLETGNLGSSATTGGSEGWNNPTGQVTVTNGVGSLDGTSLGLAASAGDRAFASATTALNARNQFATGQYPTGTTATNLYFSFLYRFRNLADVSTDGELIVRCNTQSSGTATAQHWDLIARNTGSGQIEIGIFKANGTETNYAATKLNANQTFYVVVRQEMVPGSANDVYSLWINPAPASFGVSEEQIPTPHAINSNGAEATGTGPGRLVFAAGVNSEFDELRIATSWAEVTPPVGSCVGAGIEEAPVSVIQAEGLAANFSVKPSGDSTSPTIQWQLSTDAGNNWNDIVGATASTYRTPLLFPSNNNNRYRAIVYVACNTSYATSAVASVTVTNAVVTPVGLVMHDTFLDPDLGFDDRSNPPLTVSNSLWYTATTDNLVAFNQGGNLLAIPLQASSSLWLGYFVDTNQPPVHLAVGRTIRVTLPFTPTGFNARTNNAGLRFGLFNYFDSTNRIIADSSSVSGSGGSGSGVRGYMLNVEFGTSFTDTTPMEIYARNNLPSGNLMGTTSDYVSLFSGPTGGVDTNELAFVAGNKYTLTVTVSRLSQTSVNINAIIDGLDDNLYLESSFTDTNFVYHRFDAFGIRPERIELTADSFLFSDFIVEVLQSAVPIPPFSITTVEALSPTAIKLTWESVTGATYHVLSRDSLSSGTWSTNATLVATGTVTSYTNSPTSGNQRFYQILAPPYTP
jgi:hypothetical protein